VLVRVSERVCFPPTVTLPKLTFAGLAPTDPGASPVPESSIVIVGLASFEVMITDALAAPDDCGENVAVKEVLWDAFRVNGVVIPLIWNPAPLTETFEMLTLEPPLLVSVTVCGFLAPTVIDPKFTFAGFVTSCPAANPDPDSEMLMGPFEASLESDTVALYEPAALGANLILSGVLCPAAMVTGRTGAVREKYLVEIAAPLMVTGAVPEFVALTVRVLLLEAVTEPKLTLLVPRDRVLVCCCFGVELLIPAHPLRPMSVTASRNVPNAVRR
jgi:hypothetical protein